MSASNDSVINLRRSERRTLAYFLALYITFTLLLLSLLGWVYFRFEKELMLEQKRPVLQELANELTIQLKAIHTDFTPGIAYPRDMRFHSAIFDWDGTQIFSLLENPSVNLDKVIYTDGHHIHYVRIPEAYYLGTKYIVMEIPDDGLWMERALQNILIFGTLLFLSILAVGYFLMRLFLQPMRNSIVLLDNFIKDTTHELNTPITAILTNIESLGKYTLEEKVQRKLKRIEIGARTVSNLYQDLTYLVLNHKVISQDESVDLSQLLLERIHYFYAIASQKKVTFTHDLSPTLLMIDRKKMTRVIDNLLSNAIKYNKINGTIHIRLDSHTLSIQDSGQGMPQEKLDSIFTRYVRLDNAVGGFGIGLHIVSMIAKEYDLTITYESEESVGTKVTLTW